MLKQELFDIYLKKIINIRKEYFILEEMLDYSPASEIVTIKKKQQLLMEELCRFILAPKKYIEDKKVSILEEQNRFHNTLADA